MKRNDLWFFLPTLAGALLLVLGLLSWTAQPAQAQCGSQASSCKSCHETQGQMPVNTNGQWHTVHAFGDFCEFCHAGNVQAKTKDDAHVGLVAPLDDVKAGCQSCHPTDYMDKAQVYASTLGVEVPLAAPALAHRWAARKLISICSMPRPRRNRLFPIGATSSWC